MTHLAALLLCLAGFTALAFATRRQQRDIVGGSLRPSTTYALRVFGAFALLFALGLIVAKYGWSLGLVMFSGHTTSAAALVYCALIGLLKMRASPRHRPGRSAQAN
jgi:NaMN:DMB phosphoribosyltransferase